MGAEVAAAPVETLPPAERTVPAMLLRGAERHGERTLLSFGDRSWSHREMPGLVAARAEALRAAGVGRGDRVALMLGHRIELLETFLACGWLGAAAVPINTASMGPQIGYLLKDSAARLLVIEVGFVERLENAALGETPSSLPPHRPLGPGPRPWSLRWCRGASRARVSRGRPALAARCSRSGGRPNGQPRPTAP